jgi:hypothetical protein
VIIGKKEITENTDFTSDLNKLADFEKKKKIKKMNAYRGFSKATEDLRIEYMGHLN